MKQLNRSYLIFAKWIFFIVLIIWALKIVNIRLIEDSLSSISFLPLTIFLIFMLLSRLFYALRWQQICLKGLKSVYVPMLFLMRVNLLGEFVGITTPSSLGGEALRVLKLNSVKVSKIKGTASIVLDRVIGLGSMILAVIFLLPIIGVTFIHDSAVPIYAKIFFILCAVIIFLVLVMVIRRDQILERYNEAKAQINFGFSLFIIAFIISIVGHLIFVAGFYVLFLEIYPISFLTTAAFILISQITRSIPISFLGIGIGEGTMIGLSKLLEIKAEVILVIIVLSLGSRYMFAAMGLLLEIINDGMSIFSNIKYKRKQKQSL